MGGHQKGESMKRNITAASLVTSLAVSIAAGLPSAAYAQQDFDAPFSAHRMIGNIYFVGTEGLGTFLITTPEGHILINSDFERTVPTLQESRFREMLETQREAAPRP